MKNMCMVNCCRAQEGFRGYRGIFSVMESRILWWLESDEDVFYPSPGVVNFPLVREEDAPHDVLFLIPRLRRVWGDYESDDSFSFLIIFVMIRMIWGNMLLYIKMKNYMQS